MLNMGNVEELLGIFSTCVCSLSGWGCRSDQPPSLEAEGHTAVWDSEGPTWHDGPGAQRGREDNLHTHTDASYDR